MRFLEGDHVLWQGHHCVVDYVYDDYVVCVSMEMNNGLPMLFVPRILADHQRPWQKHRSGWRALRRYVGEPGYTVDGSDTVRVSRAVGISCAYKCHSLPLRH